jgi:hypothetical protein
MAFKIPSSVFCQNRNKILKLFQIYSGLRHMTLYTILAKLVLSGRQKNKYHNIAEKYLQLL